MLRLVAQYADMWNVGYMSIPRSTAVSFKAFYKACKEVGRDPKAIEATFMVSLAFPDLLGWKKDKKRGYLTGSTEEIAEALAGYEALGVSGLMFHLTPSTPQAYERLAEATRLYRERASRSLEIQPA
jgi:alkanesulfonate monooxygenase SsuD/methylene tetrahydromethanopterin reductase-like flavin-dependent oxidoreductase (luciferase family)